ncbi:MAG: hypothetical protein H7301_13875 [Cryobacterium sp.]|nr:hypothetical protein [Oligoflexia bacterium]
MSADRALKLQEFVQELSGFAVSAEKALKLIEVDPHGNKGEFENFSEMMIAIRGTAMQLGLSTVAEMAGFGEEIAVKGAFVEKGSQIKKCVAALWDTLTTLKFMLVNPDAETGEESEILKNRLQATLRSLGGARETVSADDIEKLLRGES